MRVVPCPSPKGSNHENLWLIRAPRGVDPRGALDSAMRKAKDRKGARDEDPSEVNLGELRRKLEHYLQQALPESHYQGAIDLLDECLPGGMTYGTEDADPDATAESFRPKYPDHSYDDVREYLQGMGLGDEAVEEAMSKMPKTGLESMNAAAADRRRGGRRGAMDRAMSAADSFEAFYGTSRIKGAL
jgi:hypothetical protein